jgi:hypothetical protein
MENQEIQKLIWRYIQKCDIVSLLDLYKKGKEAKKP